MEFHVLELNLSESDAMQTNRVQSVNEGEYVNTVLHWDEQGAKSSVMAL